MGFFTYSKLICILKVHCVTGAEGSGVTESENGWDTTDWISQTSFSLLLQKSLSLNMHVDFVGLCNNLDLCHCICICYLLCALSRVNTVSARVTTSWPATAPSFHASPCFKYTASKLPLKPSVQDLSTKHMVRRKVRPSHCVLRLTSRNFALSQYSSSTRMLQ